MPYINRQERNHFQLPPELRLSLSTPGQLNYVLTQCVLAYLDNTIKNYQAFNDVIGALEGCKLELYRRMVEPYENRKILENGDCYPEEVTK